MSALSATIGYGFLSARPAAGHAGRLYYATDTGLLYRDNASTWDTLSAGLQPVQTLTPSGVASITFTPPASGFQHLRLSGQVRSTAASWHDQLRVRFNADTGGSSYSWYSVRGAGESNTGVNGDSAITAADVAAASADSDVGSAIILDIPNYRGSTFMKELTAQSGILASVSGGTGETAPVFTWGAWHTAGAPITSVTVYLDGGNYVAGSLLSLYAVQ